MGTAMAHVIGIYDRVQKATDAEAHELVARFRARSGNDETLREYMNDNARAMRNAGYASNGRTARNADGSIDSEMRIDVGEGDFHDALLTFGDETRWPQEI